MQVPGEIKYTQYRKKEVLDVLRGGLTYLRKI